MSDNKAKALEAKKEGNGFYKQKKWNEAIEAYSRAIELDDTEVSFFSNRSACYVGLKDYENSLKDAEKCIEIKPGFAKGYSRKGFALLNLNKFEEAVDAYEAGVKKFPNDEKLKTDLQQAKERLIKSQRKGLIPPEGMVKALMDPEISNWYKTDPIFKMRVDSMVNGFPEQGALQGLFSDPKLMKFMQVATGIDFNSMPGGGPPGGNSGGPPPQNTTKQSKEPTPPPKVELTEEEIKQKELTEKADALKAKGTEAYKKKDFDTALDFYKQAAEVLPEAPVYLLNQSAVFLMQKKYDECEKMCKEAIKVSRANFASFDWDAKAYNRLATVSERRGDYAQAISYLEDSLREKSDGKVKTRIKNLKRKKKKKEADDLLNPEEALQFKSKADDAFRVGKWNEAITNYGEAIKRNPKDPKVYNNRATALCKLMGWDAALEDVNKAIELDPTWVKPYLRRATIEKVLKKYHLALKTLKLALKNTGDVNTINKELVTLRYNISLANSSTDEHANKLRQQRALEDPEITAILKDPMIQSLLKQAETDPRSISEAMKKNEDIADRIEMLIAAGVIRT